MLTFIHVADLHLDRSFQGPQEAFEDLREINAFVLENIIDNAINKDVNFLVFAGDTFHQSRTSIQTQAHFIEQLKRLEEVGIPVILSFGNHDYYEKNRYWFDFPSNVHVFYSETVESLSMAFDDVGESLTISGFSYTHPILTESKLPEFPERNEETNYHIGIYHGEMAQSGRYAPFSLTDMKEKGYDYWALGHIHAYQVLSEDKPYIVYPGTPQGHNKKENHVSGVLYVTMDAGEVKSVEAIPVAQVLYHELRVDLRECRTLPEAQKAITDVLAQGVIYTLVLEKTEQLEDEFIRSVESLELLDYLNTQFWISSIKLEEEENEGKFHLFIDDELVANMVKETDVKAIKNEMRNNMPSELLELFDEDFSSEVQEEIYKELKEEYELTGGNDEN